jgi:hypothetical protein
VTGERRAFAAVAWVFLGGVILQVFLAGLGAFKVTDWTSHAGFGWLLGSLPLFVLLPLSLVAGLTTRTRWLTVALVVSAALQPELAHARAEAPVVAAIHPVNAVLLFWLAWSVARAALRDPPRAATEATQTTPSTPVAETKP